MLIPYTVYIAECSNCNHRRPLNEEEIKRQKANFREPIPENDKCPECGSCSMDYPDLKKKKDERVKADRIEQRQEDNSI